MYGCLGALAGLAVVGGLPLWLGMHRYSPLWLVALSFGLFAITTLTTRYAVTYNLLAEARARGRLISVALTILVLPPLLWTAIPAVPYIIGRVIAR